MKRAAARRRSRSLLRCCALVLLTCITAAAGAYPLDDADGSGIGRLEAARRIEAGTLAGDRQPRGALLPSAAIEPRLLDRDGFTVPAPDPRFSTELRAILGPAADRYAVAVLDLSDPAAPVYAEHRAEERMNPGSVGKVLVALAWLQLLAEVMQTPLTRNGFDLERLRQGSLFTRRGKGLVTGTSSHATPRELMRLLVAIERGTLVDAFSSRLLKRLLYQTERRIRYASSPALNESAVYFKSGSLFECQPEPDFVCKAYAGNIKNLMHSVAIVEHPAAERRLHYLVVLMSNVLRKNSAVDHQALGTSIQHLVERRNRDRLPASDAPAAAPTAQPTTPAPAVPAPAQSVPASP